jgi:hypothetical protein
VEDAGRFNSIARRYIMTRTSRFAIAAAFIFASASTAFADEHFDRDIFRPGERSLAFATYMGALGPATHNGSFGAYAQQPSGPRTMMVAPGTVSQWNFYAKHSYAGW